MLFRKNLLTCTSVVFMALMLICDQVIGHEAWLEPKSFRLQPGETLVAEWRVGQDFKGNSQPYISNWFQSFKIEKDGIAEDVKGDTGDRPAAKLIVNTPGLKRLYYHSTDKVLKFRAWEKFQSYVAYEGFSGRVEQHLDDGLPKTGFSELYQRNSKSLINVGETNVDAESSPVGMPLELMAVAGLNGRSDEVLVLKLLWQGEAMADTQVRVFERLKGQDRSQHKVRVFRTDDQGQVRFRADKGARLMISSVHLARSEMPDVTYHSWWANLTLQR